MSQRWNTHNPGESLSESSGYYEQRIILHHPTKVHNRVTHGASFGLLRQACRRLLGQPARFPQGGHQAVPLPDRLGLKEPVLELSR
jgi:hypothetical protein